MSDPAPDASKQAVSRIAALQAIAKTRTADATEWAARLRERSVIIEAAFVIYERDRVSAGSVLGSAIAFRLFLFFVPSVVFVVGLIGAFSGSVDPETVTEAASLTGALAEQVRAAHNQSSTAAYLTLFTGLFLMVTAGRSLAKALVASSSLVWLTGGKVTAKVRIVAIVIGLSASLALTSLATSRIRNEFGLAATGLSFGLSLVLYALIMVVLMTALPRRTPDPGALLPGAVLASLVLNGLLAVSQFYLPRQFSGASDLYGGIGVTVVTLGWLFFVGRILALSFAMNAALFDRFGSLSQGLFALPVLQSLPPRSERVRKYFGLDANGRSVESSPASDAVVDEQFVTGIESLSDVARAEDPD